MKYIPTLFLLFPLSLNAMGTIGEITITASLIDVQKNKIVSRANETCWSIPLKGEGEANTQSSHSAGPNTPSLSLKNLYQDPKENLIHFICVIRQPSFLCCSGGTTEKSIELPPNGSTQMPYTNKFTLQLETTTVE